MNQAATPPADPTTGVTCATCAACCCRLEVLLLTDTGVPRQYIATDPWGRQVMSRLDDGWCAALDRNTLRCRIYAERPLLCREYSTGGEDCLIERRGRASASVPFSAAERP